MGQGVVATSLHQVGTHHEEHHEAEVVAHLQVVRGDLHGGEEGGHQATPEQLTAIGQYQSGYRRRYVGQGDELPDMSSRDEDAEVAGEGPDHPAQGGIPGWQSEGAQQDVEAQHEDEEQIDIFGQEEPVGLLHPGQGLGGVVRRRNLVGGHASKHGVGPASGFARALLVLLGLLSQSHASRAIVLKQHALFHVGREEVGKGQHGK